MSLAPSTPEPGSAPATAPFPDDWLQPDWPAPARVKAVFTSRAGGVSRAPWASMNLGDHVGDLPGDVAANRGRLQRAVGAWPVFLRQVHGTAVLALDARTADGAVADGCVTAQPDVACTIMVADCLPVLLCTTDARAVAAAHAGWRGLAGGASAVGGGEGAEGVLETTVAALRAAARPGSQGGIIAWLGPCIGPTAFEVGAEVKAAFEAAQPASAGCFVALDGRPGKHLADLPALARLRLAAMGVSQVYGNDGSEPWCTVRNPSRFFSHRRDAGIGGNGVNGVGGAGGAHGFGTTGRMAACIWLD